MLAGQRGSIRLRRVLQLGIIVLAATRTITSNADQILIHYDASVGAQALSPSHPQFGWYPSWFEQPSQDPFVQGIADQTAGGVQAWQITDPGPGGTSPNYGLQLFDGSTNLANAQLNGWRFNAMVRFVGDLGGDDNQGLAAFFDDRLFQVTINKDPSGNLQAVLYRNALQTSHFVLKPPSQASSYYNFELLYHAATRETSFLFDGQLVETWGGFIAPHATVFTFGSITSDGGGRMNYREATVAILDAAPTATEQGDYNEDGEVNIADYTVWRSTVGSRLLLAADGNGSGQIDAADYQVWKRNFGNVVTLYTNAQTAMPVSEPGSVVLLSLAGIASVRVRRVTNCGRGTRLSSPL